MADRKGRIVPFGLRMPPDVKERVERAAHKSGRSVNAEIVARLEKSLLEEDEVASTLQKHDEAFDQMDDWLGAHDRQLSELRAKVEQLSTWVRELAGVAVDAPDSGLMDRLVENRDNFIEMQMNVLASLDPEDRARAADELYEELRRRFPGWTPPSWKDD
jgi:hypothetical protein